MSGTNITFSSNVVFNDGSGIAKGTTSDERKLIAFGPDIIANIKESNSSAFNIPEIDVNSFPIIEVSNGYNIRYIEEENALIAEKIGSGKASIVYVEDFTGDYISTISNPVNTFPAGNFEFNGIFSAGARKGEFAEVGSIKLSADFQNDTFSVNGQTDNSNLSGVGIINKTSGEIFSENLNFNAPNGSTYLSTAEGMFGKTNASEVNGIFYTNDNNNDYIGVFSADR